MADMGATRGSADLTVRRAGRSDAETIGRLLHDFHREYDEPTPGPDAVADRVRELLAAEEIFVLLGGTEPCGVAVLRFLPALWTTAFDCYVEELYVAPDRRGRGLGRALMNISLGLAREKGADQIVLGTSEDDIAARALYESLGFSNREGEPEGPLSFFYEREL